MTQIMHVSPIACADVMFVDATHAKTLLFRRDNEPARGEYFAMGGRIWKNERIKDAAVRKCREELELVIDSSKLVGPYVGEEIWTTSAFPNIGYHALPIFFFYEVSDDLLEHLHFDSQHSAARWFAANDPTLHPLIRERLVKLDDAFPKD